MDTSVFRAISPSISASRLWPAPCSLARTLSPEPWLPKLTIASDVLNDLRKQADSLLTGYLLGYCQSAQNIALEELCWTEASPADLCIRLDPRRRIADREIEAAIDATKQTIGKRSERPPSPEASYFIRLLGAYSKSEDEVTLSMRLVYPHCAFTLQTLSKKVQLVASPLAKELVLKSASGYRSGLLTMDQQLRVLPLLANDPLVLSCPLVGVWAKGLDDPLYDSDARLWAICTQYVTHPQILQRIGNDSNSFLVLDFTNGMACYQASLRRQTAQWQVQAWTTLLSHCKAAIAVRFSAPRFQLEAESLANSTAATYSSHLA